MEFFQNVRVGFWQNGFFADFYFWAAGFFGDLVAGFFLLIFVGKSAQKILHENPQQNAPNFIRQKSSDIFLQTGRGKKRVASNSWTT